VGAGSDLDDIRDGGGAGIRSEVAYSLVVGDEGSADAASGKADDMALTGRSE
jgi:hypothetical protein